MEPSPDRPSVGDPDSHSPMIAFIRPYVVRKLYDSAPGQTTHIQESDHDDEKPSWYQAASTQ